MTPPETSSKRLQPAHRLPPELKNLGFEWLVQTNPFALDPAKNSPWTLQDLWKPLWLASCLRKSVPALISWRHLLDIPSPCAKTVWNHIPMLSLEEATEDLCQCLIEFPKAGGRRARRRLRRIGLLALDWHDWPFYGDPETPGTIGGKWKAGTNRFFRLQTAEFVAGSFRYTVALELVQKGDDRAAHALALLEAAERCHRVQTVLADAAFFSAHFVAELTAKEKDFCVRVPINKRLASQLAGLAPRLQEPGEVAYVATAVGNPRDPYYTPFMVAFTLEHGKYRCYAMPLHPIRPYNELLKAYKRRFGIETGYRVKRQALIRTCTTNPVHRLLLFFLAAFVTNLWGLVDLALWPPYRRRTRKALHHRLPLDLFLFQLAAPGCGLLGGRPTRG